ncbi:MAG: MGMT family protein [Bacteroidales bacterium]|nr:MGMT family protein [Bacteroidales bacterium]
MDYITRYESPLGGITLAANGALTGYAAGIDRKMQLLRMEREAVPCCYP